MTNESTLRTKVSGAIESNRDIRDLVQKTNELMQDEFGKSRGHATADWELVENGARSPTLQLTFSDIAAKAQVRERFSPEEFKNDNHIRYRLLRMWGDLLELRSHWQIDQLLSTGSGREDG